jgi:mRNA interferase YafQ
MKNLKSKSKDFLSEIKESKYNYSVDYTNQFKKDTFDILKSGLDLELMRKTIQILATDGKLPNEYKPHQLKGNLKDYWECHIKGNWLLVWQQSDTHLTLMLTNTGTHQDIFGM